MEGATETALLGDEYFQTQDYLNALANYQQAADQIEQTIQLGQTKLTSHRCGYICHQRIGPSHRSSCAG